MRYHFIAKARRVVEDTLALSVEAESLGQAKKLAEKVTLEYPRGVEEVTFCYVENRETVESSLVDIERVVPTNDETA